MTIFMGTPILRLSHEVAQSESKIGVANKCEWNSRKNEGKNAATEWLNFICKHCGSTTSWLWLFRSCFRGLTPTVIQITVFKTFCAYR